MLIAFMILFGLLALAVLGLILAGVGICQRHFHARFDGGGDYYPYFSTLHPGWNRQAVSFPSNRGDTLRGYIFSYENDPKALIVLCHGYGMSLNDYLPECEYFCRRGYAVLAFDGSGVGESGGMLYGLPQHILDLDACLRYVNSLSKLQSMPLLLYGHSWGGYSVDCVSSVGQYPIRGIISASAFQVSTAGIGPHLERHWGKLAWLLLLGVRLFQRVKFGPLAKLNAVEGLKQTDAPVLILQSNDDGIIHYRDNYEVLYATFREDPQKIFLPLTEHNHNITTPPEVDKAKRKLLKALRSGTATEEQLREMDALKAQVDEELMETFARFYDQCLVSCECSEICPNGD